MTPNSTLNGGIVSPYRFDAADNPDGWRNDALEDALEIKYLGASGSLDEQPGSTSSGRDGTRGVKLYDDGDPIITGSSRRLYQRVVGLTIGENYTFSIDSRSEAMATPSEVYILNTEIADESGIDANGYSDTSVVTGIDITNDFDTWVTNSFTFDATTTEVVIYVRSLSSIDENTEVFYDNISLQLTSSLSTKNVLASKFRIYPNPAKDILTIESNNIQVESVRIFSLLGKEVFRQNGLVSREVNISNLSSGMYILKIATNSGSLSQKIVVK